LSKPGLLLLDLGGCEGCSLSIIRVLPQLSRIVEVYSRYTGNLDLKQKYDYAVLTGPICLNSGDHIEMLKKIREQTNTLLAYGSCASVGGIILYARGGQEPRPEHRVYAPLSRIVKIDYAVPGCPPAPQMLITLLNHIKQGRGFFLDLFKAVASIHKLSGFDLMDEVVLPGLCVGCGACVLSCPTQALHVIDNHPDLIPEKCIRCGTCTVRCPRFSQILIRRYLRTSIQQNIMGGSR